MCCNEGRGQKGIEPGLSSATSSHAETDTEELEPSDGPAIFAREFTTPGSEGVYAVRIDRDHARGIESVTSKGNTVGMVTTGAAPDEQEHIERLIDLLDMTSAKDVLRPHAMPSVASVEPDRVRSLYFDMDGTLADLYSVPDWLPRLRAKDPTPYEDAVPLVDMGKLDDAIRRLQNAGWHVGVVSWLSKVSDDGYSRAVSASKRLWLLRHRPTLDEINFVSYGVAKQTAVAHRRDAILVDDEPQNIRAWSDERSRRTTIDASVPSEMLRRVQALSHAS
jgi:hypothetical protein